MALLVIVIVSSVPVYFVLLELVQILFAQVIVRTVDSAMRGRYALAFARNIWLLASGALMVGLLIGGIDFFIKRSREPKTRVRLLRILLLEAAVIALGLLIVG